MAPIEIIVLLLVAVAFVAVCIRTRRKGVCADCAQGGSCGGNCSHGDGKSCAALKGVDKVTEELGRGVK